MQIDNAFAMRLKLARQAKDINYSELSRLLTRAGSPITPQAVRQWEHPTPEKVITPRPAKMKQLARLLEVNFEWLAFGSGEMRPFKGAVQPNLQLVEGSFAARSQEQRSMAAAWVGAFQAKLPESLQANAGDRTASVPPWRCGFDYLSPTLVAEIQLFDPNGAILATITKRKMWDLLLARKLLNVETLLILAPATGDYTAGAERRVNALSWEAQALGVQVKVVTSPDEAAKAIERIETGSSPDDFDFIIDDETMPE